jgi:hypothetical protein
MRGCRYLLRFRFNSKSNYFSSVGLSLFSSNSNNQQRCVYRISLRDANTSTSNVLQGAHANIDRKTTQFLSKGPLTFDASSTFTDYLLKERVLGCMNLEDYKMTKNVINYWVGCDSLTCFMNGSKLVFRLISEVESLSKCSQSWDVLPVIESFILKTKERLDSNQFVALSLPLLSRMEQINICHLKPSVKIFNLILDGVSKTDDTSRAIHIIQGIIDKMKRVNIYPDTVSYNALLYAYAQEKPNNVSNAKRCEALLKEMQSHEQNATPDTISYNICMNAWAKTGDKYAASRAEMLLKEMQDHFHNGNFRQKPTFVSFTTVIHAWALSSDLDGPTRAEAILDLMEELSAIDESFRPNAKTFGAVMNAWSRCSLPNSASKAEDLLHRMINLCKEGDKSVRPTTVHFALCIKAWSNNGTRGCSTRAMALLRQMHNFQEKGFNTKPDIGTYNSVLRAIANDDNNQKKSYAAKEILDEVTSMGLCSDLVTYNNTLRCCCSLVPVDDISRRHALRIGTETLLLFQNNNVEPDKFTFNFFIKVVDRACRSDDEKVALIRGALKFCTSSGNFSPVVLSLLKNVLTPAQLCDILNLDNKCNLQTLKVEDFPSSWSRNSDRRDFSRKYGKKSKQFRSN